MELLEERANALILLDDDRKLLVLDKNPYNLLKFKHYRSGKIRFVCRGPPFLSVEEASEEGSFIFTLDGTSLTLAGEKLGVSSAILESQKSGDSSPLLSLWNLKYVESFLAIRVATGPTVELSRDGAMLLPKSVSLEILEWTQREDGGRVAKVELRTGETLAVDRVFTHEIEERGQRSIVASTTAIVLIGRDETSQLWMHVVPPEYRSRSLYSCETWLCGGEDGTDQLFESSPGALRPGG